MEKNSFVNILHHYTASSVEEAKEILILKRTYPYCQVLHALAARVSNDHDLNNHQQELQLAAVYASDRAVLKEIMTAEEEEEEETPSELPIAYNSTENASGIYATSPIVDSNDDVIEELKHDLERLDVLRHNFEKLYGDEVDIVAKNIVTPQSSSKASTKVVDNAEEPGKPTKTKKERIVELAKALESQTQESEPVETKVVKKNKENSGEILIDEIASTKIKIDPETQRQKEQFEMIDQFIKAQPIITSAKDKTPTAPNEDLSTIKSGEFGDNVVSETLVDILIKQGKQDKAIEVLKKLIWKFPKKKAYFAAQIEELKK